MSIILVSTIIALLAITNPTNGSLCYVKDPVRGGFFIYDSSKASINNGGTVLNGWVRQYSGAANVQWFGAKGDGSDDSDAFQKAFDSEATVIEVPNVDKYYKVKNLILPEGKTLRGIGRKRIYNPYELSHVEGSCCIIYDTSGSSFIRFEGRNTIENINFYGVNRSIPAIADNSGSGLNFKNVSSCGFKVGLGNINTYTRVTWLRDCHVAQNTVGIGGLIDSHVHGCEINANTTGVYQPTGANDTQFVENKVEWNTAEGYEFYANSSCSIIGGVIDRNYMTGIKIVAATVNVTGCVLRRNGRDNTTTGSHFNIEGGSVFASNLVTKVGKDDNGNGNTAPQYIFYLAGNTSDNKVYASNSDLTGYVSSFKNTDSGELVFSNNKGVKDTTRYLGNKSATISKSGTSSFNTPVENLTPTSNYNLGKSYTINVHVRNTQWGFYFGKFNIIIAREGGNAFVGKSLNVFQTNTIALSGGSVMNVSIANIADDGSSFDVVCTATGNGNYQTLVKVIEE